jgi:predicted NUDIX family NTP pyrophosphohydrolase
MRKSAGLLVYRFVDKQPEFFLVHPGGPYWKGKEAGAWTIPKGEFEEEDPLTAAIREFGEETGQTISGNFLPLTPVRQKSGKQVWAWAIEGNPDATAIRSNEYRQEWPYKSGKWQSFPEVDKAGWFDLKTAMELINPAQVSFLQELNDTF